MNLLFEDFVLTAAGELTRAGAPVALQPLPGRALRLLAERSGELVTREELRRHLWGADRHVDAEQGVNWCIRRIRIALGDGAGAPHFVATLPRRGYRFLVPVTREEPPAPVNRGASGAKGSPGRRWAAAALFAGIVLLVCSRPGQPWPPAGTLPTVLVLPFEQLGPGAEGLAGRIATEELTNGLARVAPGRLAVIDPPTARKLQRSEECIRVLGRKVAAQFVLVGSVREQRDGLRVTAAVFRVADNRQLWAAARVVGAGGATAAYEAMAAEVAARVARETR